MADLKGTLDHMVVTLFGEGMKTRLRPTTSPSPSRPPRWTWSATSAAARPSATRTGPAAPAPPRAGSSWAAAAWSTRKVLRRLRCRPRKYSGFAFGFGIERMLMFRHSVEDMRDIVEGDVRFTLPFGMEI